MFSINSNKNSQFNKSVRDKIDVYALLCVMSRNNMTVSISGQYLKCKSEESIVKIRRYHSNEDEVLVFIKDAEEHYKVKLVITELIEFFSAGIDMTQKQWRTWKNFLSKSSVPDHIADAEIFEQENNKNMIFSPMSIAQMMKNYIDLHWGDVKGSVDILVNENETKRIFFVFNNGFTESTFYKFQHLSSILKDFINKCRRAGVEELVFWDGITTNSKRIRVEELSYMIAN